MANCQFGIRNLGSGWMDPNPVYEVCWKEQWAFAGSPETSNPVQVWSEFTIACDKIHNPLRIIVIYSSYTCSLVCRWWKWRPSPESGSAVGLEWSSRKFSLNQSSYSVLLCYKPVKPATLLSASPSFQSELSQFPRQFQTIAIASTTDKFASVSPHLPPVISTSVAPELLFSTTFTLGGLLSP